MILFTTTPELRNYVNISSNLDFEDISPSLRTAARKRVVKIIGSALASEMETYYNGGSPDQSDTMKYGLLQLLQEAVAHFGVETYIPEGNLVISGQGLLVNESEHTRAADWGRVKDVTRKHIQAGESALEEVIEYLEANSTSFSSWTTSSERESLKRFFITSLSQFKGYFTQIDSYLAFRALFPEMQTVQSMYIEASLGVDFMSELKNLTTPNSYQAQALEYIKFAIAHFTISRACLSHQFLVTPDGLRKRLVTTMNALVDKLSDADLNELNRLEKHSRETGAAYVSKLEAYLNQNASDTLFQTWRNSDKYVSPSSDADKGAVLGSGGFVSI